MEDIFMGSLTLDTDFTTLNEKESKEWILNFREMVQEAFAESDNRTCLLGNLLVLEEYVHTIGDGLENDVPLSIVLKEAIDILWNYLDGNTTFNDFQDFANNLFACVLAFNVGEDLTEKQQNFCQKYFGDGDMSGCEAQAIGWCSGLLMQLVAIEGGRLDYDEFDDVSRIDFYGVEEMLTILEDICIDLTDTPVASHRAVDLERAEGQVHKTQLFQNLIKHIQDCLRTARNANSDDFLHLRNEYQKHGLLPKQYCKDLLEY